MSTPRKLTALGRTQTVTEWAREIGIPAYIIFHRLNDGWAGDRIVSTPSRGIGGLSTKYRIEYRIWKGMRRRCLDAKLRHSENYLGRGISFCERWEKFSNFLADMGPRPSPSHSVERRDNDGNYCPENCYWATPTEQQRNKRNSRMVTHDGITMCVTAWAERIGIDGKTLHSRIHDYGWDPAKAITTPVGMIPPGPKDKLMITHEGETLSVADWAKRVGISPDTFHKRIKEHGWSVERAISVRGDARRRRQSFK